MKMKMMMMEYKIKDILSFGKPSFCTKEKWEEYTKSGQRKRFYQINLEKTAISLSLLSCSVALMFDGFKDFIFNPHPLTNIDTITICSGIIIFLITIGIVYLFDRIEELHQLEEEKEEEKIRNIVREEIQKI